MKQLSSREIRSMFLDFFEQKSHLVMPSASLIPVNDPTLLWINSGVATLKKYFDGTEVPEKPRLTNAQKSIRTNDIENVGYTARHHTLFEMLGNFSVGDYFKEDAIHFAWEFLTSEEWLALDPELLYVTYYTEDEETKQIWEQVPGFNKEHLVAEEGNFWDIGAGPCGPNTEIFYDRGEAYCDLAEGDPENYPGGENERWLEIWNLVFSQFNHMPDDTYEPLPHKNVDTGMGLERLVSVIQDTPTNFETDLFMPIIQTIETLSNRSYADAGELQVSFKVIADHIRAVTFAISDGALPSNEGRGYIIRRLIRRSVMHGRRLGIDRLFLSELVPVIVEVMGSYYTELEDNHAFVEQVLRQEEERFHERIEEGEIQLQSVIEELQGENETVIPGAKAFILYDTFGFPYELTEEFAKEHHLTVDRAGFDAQMEAQRERARNARSKEDSMSVQSDVLQQIDSEFEFVGYQQLNADATIMAMVQDDQLVDRINPGQSGWVIFNRSPFYAEMGGQIADQGEVYDGNEVIGQITDVQKAPNGQYMHRIEVSELPLVQGQSYTLQVDAKYRHATNKNHTATHLLHRGLKKVLGEHANQAGSYVGPDRLRFDFSHFGKVTEDELNQIEAYVNQMVNQSVDVVTDVMPIKEAKAMGAMALFGEKYGDVVRVVNIANDSIELCGGTHVSNTNDIGTVKVISESGIGAGIRRIEALTGQAAIEYYQNQSELLEQIQEELKVQQEDQLLARIHQLQTELKEAESKVESLTRKMMQQESETLFQQVEEVADLTYLTIKLDNQSVDVMRSLGDEWRQRKASDILVIVSDQGDKANLLVLADNKAIEKGIKAGDLVKPLAKLIGGGGGGRPDMAQAGGKNPAGIPTLLDQVGAQIQNLV